MLRTGERRCKCIRLANDLDTATTIKTPESWNSTEISEVIHRVKCHLEHVREEIRGWECENAHCKYGLSVNVNDIKMALSKTIYQELWAIPWKRSIWKLIFCITTEYTSGAHNVKLKSTTEL